MITIQNDRISVEIDPLGAEMKRITVDGEERLWHGDPAFWAGRAPVLFPFCGGLKDDRFTYQGNSYTVAKHGFARFMQFEPIKVTPQSAVFCLTSNAETLRQYPWAFELQISYTLRGGHLDIGYTVKNQSDDVMYMSIGSHEAYACPEGIEDYDLIFEKKETLRACALEGNLIAHRTDTVLLDSDTLPLYEKYFAVDALVFKDVKSRFVTLRNRKTGKSVSVDFHGSDYLLLWTKPGAGYLCIEPWTGIPPMVDAGDDITEKEGITAVDPGEAFRVKHTIQF